MSEHEKYLRFEDRVSQSIRERAESLGLTAVGEYRRINNLPERCWWLSREGMPRHLVPDTHVHTWLDGFAAAMQSRPETGR